MSKFKVEAIVKQRLIYKLSVLKIRLYHFSTNDWQLK